MKNKFSMAAFVAATVIFTSLLSCSKEETSLQKQPTKFEPGSSKFSSKNSKGSSCSSGWKYNYGKYTIHNNIWGNGAGWQCVWEDDGSGWMNWGVDAGHTATSANNIKGYPSIYMGWHWTDGFTNGSNLPKKVNALSSVTSSWSVSRPGSGRYNTSYDLWFHSAADPNYSNPQGEVMVWLNRQGAIYPAGSKVTNINAAGRNWDVYDGKINGWEVVSYVATTNTNSVSNLDLKAIINDAKNRGINSNWYLTSIQAGWEIIEGGSGFKSNSFSASVQ